MYIVGAQWGPQTVNKTRKQNSAFGGGKRAGEKQCREMERGECGDLDSEVPQIRPPVGHGEKRGWTLQGFLCEEILGDHDKCRT